MSLPVIQLKRKYEQRFLYGHDWIFSNEIEPEFKHLVPGELCDVLNSNGYWVSRGYINPNSLVTFRSLTRKDEEIDESFYRTRILQALTLREKTIQSSDSYRVIYSESDGLPGLLVDKYNDVLSVQINSAGLERVKDVIIQLLDEILQPKAIVLRNDHYHRSLENLPEEIVMAKGSVEDAKTIMNEHGLTYEVDVYNGQKTGLYLDQRENRFWFRSLIKEGDRVFDGFCNEGGFALNAKVAGASEVIGVDIAEHVLLRAIANAQRNDLKVTFYKNDLMKSGSELLFDIGLFDVVNLDPPNFTRTKKNIAVALRGYEKMHRMGIKLLKSEGFLVTATCSHHITEEAFIDTVKLAAYKEKRTLKLIFKSSHASDHPIHPSMPETEYLKLFAFQVI